MSVDNGGQRRVHRQAWLASSSRIEKRVTNDPMEAHYIGFNMWVKAVEKAGTIELGRGRRRRSIGITVPEPDRRLIRRDAPESPPLQAGADRRDPG